MNKTELMRDLRDALNHVSGAMGAAANNEWDDVQAFLSEASTNLAWCQQALLPAIIRTN